MRVAAAFLFLTLLNDVAFTQTPPQPGEKLDPTQLRIQALEQQIKLHRQRQREQPQADTKFEAPPAPTPTSPPAATPDEPLKVEIQGTSRGIRVTNASGHYLGTCRIVLNSSYSSHWST